MAEQDARRREMVRRQIAARGIRDARVLAAMARVPREAFVPPGTQEFAYTDSPLPIGQGQTISQPYIVAAMAQALELKGRERVLEIGTGSGYAAAVLAELGARVHTVERHHDLAQQAQRRLAASGYGRVQVRHGDGTRGWPEAAPFDAIVVAAGGPTVPASLREQLAVGGRLVMPVGAGDEVQRLVRQRRTAAGGFVEDDLGAVRFVPLIGAEGWPEEPAAGAAPRTGGVRRADDLKGLIAAGGEALQGIGTANLEPLLERIGDARLVLLGEASHGTAEFYRMRAQITRALIQRRGLRVVAAEADWPDAARIDQYVRQRTGAPASWRAFARFPAWMWRNREVRAFVDWLHRHNAGLPAEARTAFYGLDLYSLSTSIAAVLAYLDRVDAGAAALARERYGCLTPWQSDPASYGRMALSDRYRDCAPQVQAMLRDLLEKRLEYGAHDDAGALDAVQNARLIGDAERYYRAMFLAPEASWNLRDTHMFETLQMLLAAPGEKAVVWAHNSHLGDARATEMSARGEHNLGQLCREAYGDAAYLIGFGTHEGTVAAAPAWDAPVQFMRVRPSHPDSYEFCFHGAGVPALTLPLRAPRHGELREALAVARLQRAIGVVYRPETERASHYYGAELPRQFDEYIWFDRTRHVHPLETSDLGGVPATYPFGV